MKFWTAPVAGAVIAGLYEALHLRAEWSLGSDHVSRASGAVVAYVLIGAFIGLIVSMFVSSDKPK